MTDYSTPTPPREPWDLETPFGAATVNDWRGPDDEDVRALVAFERLTLNNKEYRNVRVYLQTMSGPRDTGPHYYWNISTAWGDLTPAAKRKLIGFLDEQQALKAYLAPLPTDDVERLRRDRLRRKLAQAVAKAGEAEDAPDFMVDEVLRDMLNAHNAGKSFMDQWLRPEEGK